MHLNRDTEERCWYVIYTKPMNESRVESNLKALQVETFAPKIKVRRENPFTGSLIYVSRPLFPRYTFAKFKLSESLRSISFTRGVQSVVSFNNRPSVVDEKVIKLLQSRVGEDGFVRMNDKLRPGDKVIIKGGPLKNIVGIFDSKCKDHERVSILLTAVSFQSSVVVDEWLVAKLDHTSSQRAGKGS